MDYVKMKELEGEINHSEKGWRSFIECLRDEKVNYQQRTPQTKTKINLKLEQKPESLKWKEMEHGPVLGLMLRLGIAWVWYWAEAEEAKEET